MLQKARSSKDLTCSNKNIISYLDTHGIETKVISNEKCDKALPPAHREQRLEGGRLGWSSWDSFRIGRPLTTGGSISISIIMPPGVLETQLHTVGDGSSQKRQMERREEARKQRLQLSLETSSGLLCHAAHEILSLHVLSCNWKHRIIAKRGTPTLPLTPAPTLSLKPQKRRIREKYQCSCWSQC